MRSYQNRESLVPPTRVVEAGSLVFHLIVIVHVFGAALGLAIVIAGLFAA